MLLSVCSAVNAHRSHGRSVSTNYSEGTTVMWFRSVCSLPNYVKNGALLDILVTDTVYSL